MISILWFVTVNISKKHWFSWCALQFRSQYGSPIIVWVDPPCATRNNCHHVTRKSSRQHGLQLEVFADNDQRMAFSRYLFNSVKIWNHFPAQAINSDSLCSYHSCFTQYSRTACSHNIARWKHLFSQPTVHLHIFKLWMPETTVPYRSVP